MKILKYNSFYLVGELLEEAEGGSPRRSASPVLLIEVTKVVSSVLSFWLNFYFFLLEMMVNIGRLLITPHTFL